MASYVLKSSAVPLTEATFDGAGTPLATGVPRAPGSVESYDVFSRTGAARYFAIAARDSAGNTRTYINGTLSTSSSLAGSFSQWASFKLGVANDLSGSRPWVGDLHLVAVYSQALSSTQVRQNYLAGPN